MEKIIRTYSELISIPDFKERFEYCRTGETVGEDTFGSRRWLNQVYYHTDAYRKMRREVILRDKGNDLAHSEHPIGGMIILHHLNPITPEDIINGSEFAWNKEYMVAVSEWTHKAIHFGDYGMIDCSFAERRPNDTCPWRK